MIFTLEADDSTPEGREEIRRLANAAALEDALRRHLHAMRLTIKNAEWTDPEDWRSSLINLRAQVYEDLPYDLDEEA